MHVRRRGVRGVVLAIASMAALAPPSATRALAAVSDSAGWISVCPFSHRAQVDPIVAPHMRSMHMHDFFGNMTTDRNSTYKSLLAGGTTCFIKRDRAAYWIPTLVLKSSGKRVRPREGNFY